jgi:hypothetical protein
MEGLARLLLRFILVPLGYFAGVLAGTLVILLGSWKIGRADALEGEAHAIAVYGYVFAAPVLLVVLLSVMWLPAAIGVLLAETFALRSWMFHAGNGVVSAWIAWNLFGYMDASHISLNQARSGDRRRPRRGLRLLGHCRLERRVLEAVASPASASGAAGRRGLTSAANSLANPVDDRSTHQGCFTQQSMPPGRPADIRSAARRLRQLRGLGLAARQSGLSSAGAAAAIKTCAPEQDRLDLCANRESNRPHHYACHCRSGRDHLRHLAAA